MKNQETEAGLLYKELHAVITRWRSEGDNMTAFGVIGALEAVKYDVMENLTRYNTQPVDMGNAVPAGLVKCDKCGWAHELNDECVRPADVPNAGDERHTPHPLRPIGGQP